VELQDLGLGLRGWRWWRRVNKLREVGVNRDDLLVIVVRSVTFKGEMRECPIGLRRINNARARASECGANTRVSILNRVPLPPPAAAHAPKTLFALKISLFEVRQRQK
jgi:hypothetical protein